LTPAVRVNVLLLPQQSYVMQELVSVLGAGLLPVLRGSDVHTRNESVSAGIIPAEWPCRHAEPSVLEKALLPCRSSRRISYGPEAGAVISTRKAEAPRPLPKWLMSGQPSLGSGLKYTSPVEASTPTVASFVGAN